VSSKSETPSLARRRKRRPPPPHRCALLLFLCHHQRRRRGIASAIGLRSKDEQQGLFFSLEVSAGTGGAAGVLLACCVSSAYWAFLFVDAYMCSSRAGTLMCALNENEVKCVLFPDVDGFL
jgi:hypothetical protein